MPAPELSIGQVSRRTGLPISTLHFYEARGLVQSRRTAGNQRRYARSVLRLIAIIRVAQKTGIPLAEIRDRLDRLPQERAVTADDWAALSTEWRGALDERISLLTRLRDQLGGCIGCGCLSLTACPLWNPDDSAAKEGPGARAFRGGADAAEPSV